MTTLPLAARIILTEIRFGFVRLVKYPVKAVINCLLFYVIFMGMALGLKAVAPYPVPGSELAGAIAGFLLWLCAMLAIDAMGQSLSEDTQVGTLEQVCLSRLDLRLILFARMIGSLITDSVMIMVVLTSVVMSTGARLRIDLAGAAYTIVIILLLTFGLAGIGFMIASLVVLVKRLGNLVTLVQFGLLGLVVAPTARLQGISAHLLRGIPLVRGTHMLTDLFGINAHPSPADLGWLTLTCACWLSVGWFVFGRVLVVAKRNGLLGHY